MADAPSEYQINEKCIIGMPSCGYGFSSARLCFVARPADDEFQLETDILTAILKDRNYDSYVAMQRLDPGNFAFCTKICSKIITSQFCIVLLNRSKALDIPNVRIPNPNVHFEYGMMLSFHKSVIPMQRDTETLAFNIFPIDTIKYNNGNFREKAENAIDEIILRHDVKTPATTPIGSASDVMRYFAFKGMRYTITSTDFLRYIYSLGEVYGFNLFNSRDGFVFFGSFHQERLQEIAIRIKLLIMNIKAAWTDAEQNKDRQLMQQKSAVSFPPPEPPVNIFDKVSIQILVPETADVEKLTSEVSGLQTSIHNVPVTLIKPSDLEKFIKAEYEKIKL